MRRFILTLFTAAALIPLITFAATDVQTLLTQIQALQAQTVALQQASAIGASYSSAATCDLPSRSLRRGLSGDDVSRLQQFLARDSSIYPEGIVSGYFGILTERAVQRWQARNEIVTSGIPAITGFGVVGPRTLAAMQTGWCLHSQIAPSPFTPPAGNVVQSNAPRVVMSVPLAQKLPSSLQPPPPPLILTMTPRGSTTSITSVTSTTFLPTLPSISRPLPPPPPPPRVMFTLPGASSMVNKGNTMTVTWGTDVVPTGASITLSLRTKSGQQVGVIKSNLSPNGTYYWPVPNPPLVQTSICSGSPITCVTQIAQTSQNCGSICSVADGLYKFYAQLVKGGRELATAESRIFSIGGVALSTTDIAYQGTHWDFSSTATTSSYSTSLFYQNPMTASSSNSTTSTMPMCMYSGVPYSEGITVQVNCADVTAPGQSCGSYGGMTLTCTAGGWVDQNGAIASIPGVTTINVSGSCVTPWNAMIVNNGQQVPREPFFTNGAYSSSGLPLIMQCSNGSWLTCSTIGDYCS